MLVRMRREVRSVRDRYTPEVDATVDDSRGCWEKSRLRAGLLVEHGGRSMAHIPIQSLLEVVWNLNAGPRVNADHAACFKDTSCEVERAVHEMVG